MANPPDPEKNETPKAPKVSKSVKAETQAPAPALVSDAPEPSIGRIVRYSHPECDDVIELAAIVTNVARLPEMTVVCLTVFDSFGTTFGTTGVKYGTGPGEWHWPERN